MKKKTEHDAELEIEKKAEEENSVPSPSSDIPVEAEQEAAPVPSDKNTEQSEMALAIRVAELEKLNADLNDQYLRKAADFDNYRKRMLKEKQEAIEFANTNLLVDLVQILDDFDRAIKSTGVAETGTQAASVLDGVTMIRSHMASMLDTKYGLTYYPVEGQVFDPHVHEAIGTIPSMEVKEPTVTEEFMKGYKLRDRVIRVAKVMVQMPLEIEKQ